MQSLAVGLIPVERLQLWHTYRSTTDFFTLFSP